MNKNMPVVSVIILCYRNFRYVYDAISSVLEQDYPCVELIVSDDGSTAFPLQKIQQYIDTHKKENIVRVHINRNAQNMGTVKHLNIAMKLAHGAYKMSLSADDMLNGPGVLSAYVEAFEARQDADILMAQTAMYDETMETVEYYFVQPHIRDLLLHDQESDALFNELVQTAVLPAVSTFFRHTFFEKYGYFDERYQLVEDWSLHLKLARKHIPIVYLDFVSIRHRSGGISHGNTAGKRSTYFRYLNDLMTTYALEIAPYAGRIRPKIWRMIEYRHKRDLAWIDLQITCKPKGRLGIPLYAARHPAICLSEGAHYVYHQMFGKQWNTLLLSLFVLCISPWLAKALAVSGQAVFGWTAEAAQAAIAAGAQGCAAVLMGAGLVILILYFMTSLYCNITEEMQIYF